MKLDRMKKSCFIYSICWLDYIKNVDFVAFSFQIFTSFSLFLKYFSAGQTDLLLCNLPKSQQHCCNRRIHLDWILKTVVFLDGLLLIAEHIKYTRSREDYQDSFTLSSLLFLKTSFASALWQRESKRREMPMP